MNLGGRTVLVTGATGGIGAAAARAVAARGASVLVSGRRAEELEAVAAEVGGRALVADLVGRRRAGARCSRRPGTSTCSWPTRRCPGRAS